MKNYAVIVDVLRTPMGRSKPGGAFFNVHPTELLARLFKVIVERNNLDPGTVDDVIVGCSNQIGEQSGTPGRVAWLGAGFPENVPSTTIDRKCGSGQQAIHFAAQGIMAGVYDIVVAGGVESMSHVPLNSALIGKDPYGPSFHARYSSGLISQGVSAEIIAARAGISREQMDAYALGSHQRAEAARLSGQFAREILPITVVREDGTRIIDKDETIRPETTLERLASLRPAFENLELESRFPEIRWGVTAGNSSQIADGAAVALIMSERMAAELNLTPRARLVAFDVRGDDPLLMLTAPISATQRILKKGGIKVDDISHFEVNEAFASVPLAWQKELGVDDARLNPSGGAIAMGHPLGASGVRLMTTMLNTLERTGGRYGLQTMCEKGGMANATIIERI